MAKPFKLDSSGPSRTPDGKFAKEQRPDTPSPVEVRKRAEEQGRTIFEVGNESKAPEHQTPRGNPKSGEEIPWPVAGPNNDANKKPFRVS